MRAEADAELKRLKDVEIEGLHAELKRLKDAEIDDIKTYRTELATLRKRETDAAAARLVKEDKEREDRIKHTRQMDMYSAQSTFSLHMARHTILPGTGGSGMFQPPIPTWTQPEALMQYTPSHSDPKK